MRGRDGTGYVAEVSQVQTGQDLAETVGDLICTTRGSHRDLNRGVTKVDRYCHCLSVIFITKSVLDNILSKASTETQGNRESAVYPRAPAGD